MSQNQNSRDSEAQPANQQQSLGDVQVQGDDNIFNVIQAEIVTLTQTKIIQISVDEIKTRELITTSPYKGLKKFEPGDHDRFFGRDQFLAGLVNDLEHTIFILLLGASGSGKSSIIRAGLIPWLQQKWGKQFVSLMFTPDRDPFESLYGSLLSRGYSQTQAQIAKVGKAETLSQVVKTLKPSETFWLIFIDQLEELFTVSEDDKRDRFIEGLIKLSQTSLTSVKIVATMRADFLDHLSPYPRLVKVTDRHRPLIAEMQMDELRLAIEQPAAHHGVVFETGLVEEIISAVQGQAGCLPLLQYTLDLLWESEVQDGGIYDRTLNITSYRRLGGVRGALQQRVDQIYEALSKSEQLAAQRIFLKLVEIGGDAESGTEWKPVRRRANRSEFKDDLEKTVLTQLINEMLLVSDRPSPDQDSTIEIAHEILLTSWMTLNHWIEENRQAIALRNRLNADVALWQLKKADSELWSGAKLEKIAELRKDPTFTQVLGGLDFIANDFINISLAKRDRELRFYQSVAVGAIAALAFITGSLAFAGIKWRTADQDRIQAELTSSKALFDRNPVSLNTLLEALKATTHFQHSFWLKEDTQLKATAMETLAQAVYAVREHNQLESHTGIVNSVRFSHDGQMIGTASFDKTAKLWSADGKELHTLTGHTDWVTDICFSPDGQTIATASRDGTTILWDRKGKRLQTLKGHTGGIWSVQFSPNGHMIATASGDKTVKLWDLNGYLLNTFKGHTKAIYMVRFNPTGSSLVTVSADKTIKVWNLRGNVIRSFEGHKAPVTSVNFSPDGQAIVTASMDDTVIIWDFNKKSRIRTLPHPAPIADAIFSPDGQTIATASNDKIVRLWHRDGTLLETLPGHQDLVNSLSFNRDGKILASASNDKTVKLWQQNPWRLSFNGHRGPIYSLDISPDGQNIISASDDGTVRIWNSQGQLLTTFSGHKGNAICVRFHPNEKMFATVSITDTNSVTGVIWDLQGKEIRTVRGLRGSIPNISFSPDGKTIAFASSDKTVKIWDHGGNGSLKSLPGHNAPVWDVDFSRDGKTIVSGDANGIIKLWNEQGKLLYSWQGHNERIYSTRISHNNQIVATASEDGSVKLWDRQGHLLHVLKGHTAAVTEVRFSLNDQMITTASTDKTVKLWTAKGKLITTLIGHIGSVNSLGFTPDSKMLVTASDDTKLLLWNIENLNMNGLITRGCNSLQDYFRTHSNISTKSVCDGILN